MLTILFDGVAYGMLLFVLAVRAVRDAGPDELRQPRAWRLRHGRRLRHRRADEPLGVPFLACLPLGLPRRPRCSAPSLERTLYRHLYARDPPRPGAVLDRPRLHVRRGRRLRRGLAAADHPAARRCCRAASRSSACSIGVYRLFLIVVCGVLAVGAAIDPGAHALRQPACARRWTIRASRAASASTSAAIFAVTFAVGSGLAGLGGALGAEMLGLDPTFPLKFMIYFLIVVTVGGTTQHHRAVPGRAAARHRRRRRQVLRARRSAPSSSTR